MFPDPRADDESKVHPLTALRISGTEVHYYVLCPRKLWWYAHGLEQECSSG